MRNGYGSFRIDGFPFHGKANLEGPQIYHISFSVCAVNPKNTKYSRRRLRIGLGAGLWCNLPILGFTEPQGANTNRPKPGVGFITYPCQDLPRKIGHSVVWAAPGLPETFAVGGGRSPPHFAKVCKTNRAAQAPRMADFLSLRKSQNKNKQAKVQPCASKCMGKGRNIRKHMHVAALGLG